MNKFKVYWYGLNGERCEYTAANLRDAIHLAHKFTSGQTAWVLDPNDVPVIKYRPSH